MSLNINFGNCGDYSRTIANIVSARVSGVDWYDKISNSEARGIGCNITSINFVKFDDPLSAAVPA